uniref:ubiquitinyl hydrolase 1 n=1 Tax=Chromera velia CCMP2878 TaxID=1169474 RepID=A0A0G4GJE0_9ALVE|eukprot:Cvel_4795.t1-p1 / transcript=Cvel_4795.t1 / gene=Cvel_4795 / organism=Chromera_velia_CCMP2878 / gene_product=Ubiquitin carboxyl-terminal hydrolase 6, putative / transcript_product=Ubiquitin carboxyl-terminal hydrolase 6, putative / location=Cvel_scaffold214:62420-70261(+) / protein_length=333 / sequence_SO=supercontig / SO=protein_coding / is_pseudo=false
MRLCIPETHQKLAVSFLRSAAEDGEQSLQTVTLDSSGKQPPDGPGVSLPFHTALLCGCSPVFKAMFSRPEFEESKAKKATLQNISAECLKAVRDLLYTGSTDVDLDTAVAVLEFFDQYEAREVLQELERCDRTSGILGRLQRDDETSESEDMKKQKKMTKKMGPLPRGRFPQFAQTTSGGQPMQQDSAEILQCLFESLVRSTETPGRGTNLVDKLFRFNLHVSLKCLENATEKPTTETSAVRKLSAFPGDRVKPIDHLHQGLSLSLDETIEKESPSLGRTAAYSKVARVTSLPEYLIIHLVRFEWKKAEELAPTDACKTKITRKMTFPHSLDI